MRGTEKVERDTSRRLEMWQGLKPGVFLWSFCGLTEVMPFYKARFDGVVAAA
jgi:hypothetical protein